MEKVEFNYKYITEALLGDKQELVPFSDKKLIAIESAPGTGKTEFIARYVSSSDQLLFIAPHISLVDQAALRLNLSSYHDQKILRSLDKSALTTPLDNIGNGISQIKFTDRLAICLNSVAKLKDFNCFQGVLVIDEARKIFDLLHSTFLSDHEKQLIKTHMRQLVIQARQVILLDANFDRSFEAFLELLEIYEDDSLFLKNIYSPYHGRTIYMLDNRSAIIAAVLESINKDNRVFIACDTKIFAEQLDFFLSKQFCNKKGLCIVNKENLRMKEHEEFVRNPSTYVTDNNISWVIVSPKITCGVDIPEGFDQVFGFYQARTLKAREAWQQLTRVRNIFTDINIFIQPGLHYFTDSLASIAKKNFLTVCSCKYGLKDASCFAHDSVKNAFMLSNKEHKKANIFKTYRAVAGLTDKFFAKVNRKELATENDYFELQKAKIHYLFYDVNITEKHIKLYDDGRLKRKLSRLQEVLATPSNLFDIVVARNIFKKLGIGLFNNGDRPQLTVVPIKWSMTWVENTGFLQYLQDHAGYINSFIENGKDYFVKVPDNLTAAKAVKWIGLFLRKFGISTIAEQVMVGTKRKRIYTVCKENFTILTRALLVLMERVGHKLGIFFNRFNESICKISQELKKGLWNIKYQFPHKVKKLTTFSENFLRF